MKIFSCLPPHMLGERDNQKDEDVIALFLLGRHMWDSYHWFLLRDHIFDTIEGMMVGNLIWHIAFLISFEDHLIWHREGIVNPIFDDFGQPRVIGVCKAFSLVD